MIFSSINFVFLFLPSVLIVYYLLIYMKLWETSKIWLILASLFFYAFWDINYLPLIVFSIVFNFILAKWITITREDSLFFCFIGVLVNLALLFYFKYLYFFDSQILASFGGGFSVEKLILPLGISFFTFQQLAFLIDIQKGYKADISLINYTLFVSFFPQLIAGPIVHHSEMMPQFDKACFEKERWKNLNRGLFIFAIGLFKKVVIADTLSSWVDLGYADPSALGSIDAWYLSIAYTFQLYYDFSGYADMAIGIALMFNVKLPLNFNSPYKATNIQDFWRRWHMTLSRWFRDYVYIPLGGNQKGEFQTLINVFLTAFVSGIWHGAGWTFIVWGTLHGLAMVFHRSWTKLNILLSRSISILFTFFFINTTWVFFRAASIDDAILVLSKMFNFGLLKDELISTKAQQVLIESIEFVLDLPTSSDFSAFHNITLIILSLLCLEVYKKSEKEYFVNKVLSSKTWLTPYLLTVSFWFMSVETVEKFIYFNF